MSSGCGNKHNKLTKIDVQEVSLVDKGAIGETFSIIKGEDTDPKQVEEILKQYYAATNEDVTKVSSDEIISKLKSLDESQFVGVMKDLLNRYNEINKSVGGNKEMDEQKIVEIVTKAMSDNLKTFNDNFKEVNKSITGIQNELEKVKDSVKEPKDPQTDPKKDPKSEDNKEVAKTLGDMSTALDNMVDKLKTVDEIKKVADSLTAKVDNLEKAGNPSNQAPEGDPAKVQKSGEVKWKSFVQANQE